MTPEELAAAVIQLLGDAARCTTSYGLVTVDVPRNDWVGAVSAVRDGLGLTFFDLLTAVDELDAGFDGHPELRRLLLPDGFEGHPMRKEFVLAARVEKPWPGAKDPGESDSDLVTSPRRRMQPPGVPRPGAGS